MTHMTVLFTNFIAQVIITSILRKYYDISNMAVYWTSMIYMVLYIPLIFPASWLLDKKVFKI